MPLPANVHENVLPRGRSVGWNPAQSAGPNCISPEGEPLSHAPKGSTILADGLFTTVPPLYICSLAATLSHYWHLHPSSVLDLKPWNEASMMALFLNFQVNLSNYIQITITSRHLHPATLAHATLIFPGLTRLSISALAPQKVYFPHQGQRDPVEMEVSSGCSSIQKLPRWELKGSWVLQPGAPVISLPCLLISPLLTLLPLQVSLLLLEHDRDAPPSEPSNTRFFLSRTHFPLVMHIASFLASFRTLHNCPLSDWSLPWLPYFKLNSPISS